MTTTALSPSQLDQQIKQEFGAFPALAAPSGVTSDFDHPYSRGYLVVIGSAIIVPITTIFVLLRTYTKHFINKNGLVKEDYACLVAFVGFVAYNAMCLWVLKFGDGVHQWNVPIAKAMRFAQGANYLEIVYSPTIFFAKIALLLSLKRLFAPIHQGATHWLCVLTMWFILLFYTAVVLVASFACWPREKIWDPLVPGKCVNPPAVLIATSAINSATDLVILFLPLVSVWKLQMGRNKKWGVSAIFATGFFAVLCSIMRLVNSVQLLGKQDLTFLLVDQGLWANGELGSGIIAGCMMSLPQFYRSIAPKMVSWASWTSRSRKSGNITSSSISRNRAASSEGLSSFSPTDVSVNTRTRRDYIELEERAAVEERVRRFTISKTPAISVKGRQDSQP